MAEQNDWWDEISEEQRQAIDEAMLESKAGKLTTHEEVMKKYNMANNSHIVPENKTNPS
jgi:predicted transcriptional regulator